MVLPEIKLTSPEMEMGESVKLIRNTKGWNWEIRIRETGENKLNEKTIERLDFLNSLMMKRYTPGESQE